MLGPGMFLLGIPAAVVVSVMALNRRRHRSLGALALAVTGFDVFLLLYYVVYLF